MSKFRVAVIGCGWVSGEHIRAYKNNPDTEVIALASLTKEEAEAKAHECSLSVPCYDSLDEMLDREKPDILSITSRPDVHVEHALKAAKSGTQLVLEKPIALNQDELSKLVQGIKANQAKSVVSFVLRWNPLFNIIRSLLDDGTIGDPFLAEIDYYHGIGPWYGQFEWNKTRKAGGNSLLSAGCHAVDALVWFMGSKVKEVHALSTRSDAPNFKEYEYDPTIMALLKFENGKIGKITSCIECNSPYIFPIRLFGNKGTIHNNKLYSDKMKGQTDFATIPTIMPDSGDVTHHPFQGEIDHFVNCLKNGKDSDVPISYAAHIMEICLAAEISAKSGQSVKLPL